MKWAKFSLTVFFFKSVALATPTKSKNPTGLGLGVPAGRLGKEEQAKITTFFEN